MNPDEEERMRKAMIDATNALFNLQKSRSCAPTRLPSLLSASAQQEGGIMSGGRRPPHVENKITQKNKKVRYNVSTEEDKKDV